LWAVWQDAVFGRLEDKSTDDDSDALIVKVLMNPSLSQRTTAATILSRFWIVKGTHHAKAGSDAI
jgi:hypothetical protein